MMNYIWSGLMVLSFLVAVFTGKIEQTTGAAFEGATSAVTLCISLLGIMCLWTGLIKIAEKAGLVKVISKILTPVTKLLFPELPDKSPAKDAIVMNMVANMLGMSNAATPLGLKAMKELDRLNKQSATASNAMCMFLVINTASIQLVPSTLIALRQAAGSVNPSGVIVPIWIASFTAVFVGVVSAKIFQRNKGRL